MARTDWTTIIIGGSVLVAGVYALINWKTVCPKLFGMQNCDSWPWKSGDRGLFGGTLIGPGLTQGYGQIYTDPTTGKKTQIDPKAIIAGASAPAKGSASISKLRATGSARIGAGAGAGAKVAAYTDTVNSFNTFTLNRVSIR